MAAPVQLVPHRDDAIRFPGREEAEACCHAAPADAPLRPDGTPDRPLSVCRVAVEYEPPRLAPVAENSGRRASWNSSTWTGLLTLPRRCPAT